MNTSTPTHLGLILDGNRRWARAQGLPTLMGHKAGYDNFKVISRHAFASGVKYVSAYAFSTENWDRSVEEVSYLMDLIREMVKQYGRELEAEGVRFVWLGCRTEAPPDILTSIDSLEKQTAHLTDKTLCMCFNYGGHREIVEAIHQAAATGIDMNTIDEKTFATFLYHPEVPPVDYIIRTSGEMRISGYMLWRASYAELYFSDKHWPAFTKEDLDAALTEYASRQRRFGK
ncbi:MAG: polyprenyl diphosphate synthase [bacterium]